jgi:hypothetical protein
MKCTICDLPLKPEWKFCPDCGYNTPDWDEHIQPLFDDYEDSITVSVGNNLFSPPPDSEQSFAPPVQPYQTSDGNYNTGVRAQVFEVIVRQAMAGAPWRTICAGPMLINKILPEEIEEEVRRRREMLGNTTPGLPPSPPPHPPAKVEVVKVPMPAERLVGVRSSLEKLLADKDLEREAVVAKIREVLAALDSAINTIASQQDLLDEIEREAQLQRDLDREIRRKTRPLGSNDDRGRHFFT